MIGLALVVALYLAVGWWVVDYLCTKDGEELVGGEAVLGVALWPTVLIGYVWFEVVPKIRIGGKK